MDPLEVAFITAHAAHLSAPDEIEAAFNMPRYHGARNFRLDDYGVQAGARANLLILDATSAVDALRRRGDRRYVIRDGRILAESRSQTKWNF